ncbi:MAG: glutamate-1-semialdehyde 2,1-aminomutase [Deltaproteobacteria bacterium]|nr:glutamate-1-semialdehyde 2,1-aminomutase [Deltaproteobacteria bacterium]
MEYGKSTALFERATSVTPGGVNSPVRACKSVGGDPLFLQRGDGAYVYDVDGNRFVDTVGSWGPMIVGHAHPTVLAAVREALARGSSFGAPTELEVEFAEKVCSALPAMDQVRAVSSGTEATMSALRLARGYTGRDKIIKIDGGYHGHADFLLVAAGSGAATLGIPGSSGVPKGTAQDTLLIPYNDLDRAKEVFAAHEDQIAALIIEPIAGNMGVVPPKSGYLHGLRQLCNEYGTVLILDEVMTGFRVAYGGAQVLYDVKPDLTCLGKVVGGGLPAAAFGGKRAIMEHLAPVGQVYQAGTLSGSPLAMAAGLATLELLGEDGAYDRLEAVGARLEKGLLEAAEAARVPASVNRVGSMLTLFFTEGPVENYEGAKASNTQAFAKYFMAMRERGISLPPSQFEGMFLSLAHSDSDIDEIVAKAAESLRSF